MKKRTLGQNFDISGIGFGCMRLNASYVMSIAIKEERVALLRAAVERGVTPIAKRSGSIAGRDPPRNDAGYCNA